MTHHRPSVIPAFSLALSVSLGVAATAQQFPLGDRTQLTAQLEQTSQPTAGDFNGDGHVDVLVSSVVSAGIRLLIGDGQAGFSDPFLITDFDRSVLSFTAADLDGDGDLDVAALLRAGASGSERLVRLLNDGSGAFTAETIRENMGMYEGLEVADLTGDGAPDLVLSRFAGGSYEVVYLAAQGAGYSAPSSPIANASTASFTVADIDGDGVLDVATNSGLQDELSFSKGLAGGTFAPGTTIQAAGGTTIEFPSRLLDIDGDGDTDCLQLTGTAMRYFDGLGGGSFAPPAAIGASSFVAATQIFDADGDGDLDVANVQTVGPPPFFLPDPKVFLQTSPGVFGAGTPTTAVLETALEPLSSTAIADIDGNGRVDLIRGGGTGDLPLRWQLSNQPASSGFFGDVEFLEPSVFFSVSEVGTGDLDGDGDDDVVIANRGSGMIGWVENLAPGITAPPQALFSRAAGLSVLHVLDVDGDGDTDIVVQPTTVPTVPEFWVNDGSQGFSLASSLATIGSGVVRTFHVEDMDGDGDADLLVSKFAGGFGDQEAWLYSNNGAAKSFTPSLVFDASLRAVDVRVGEFNGDSVRDLVVTRFIGIGSRYRLEVSLGLGGGSFGAAIMLPVLVRARTVSLGDFDSDGLTDIFVWDTEDGILLRRAMGGGMFESPVQLLDEPSPTTSSMLFPVDFDADGDADILYPRGTSSGSFFYLAEQLPGGVIGDGFPASGGPTGVTGVPQFADLDGDGDGELITAGFGTASAFENLGTVNVGSSFCTGPANVSAALSAVGTEILSDNRISLVAAGLDANVFGIAVGARTFGPQVLVAGTQGYFCLTGPIGRYDGPGQILNSGPAGLFALDLDLNALETPGGSVPGQVGESWSFQIWHRVSGSTSRFTSGVTVQLR